MFGRKREHEHWQETEKNVLSKVRELTVKHVWLVMEEEAECVWISCSFLRAAATTHKEKSVGVTGESSLKWKE